MEATKIQLDRERTLNFNLNALRKIEKETGKKISELADGFGLDEMQTVLWAGLVHEDPELTFERVGEIVDIQSLGKVGDAIAEAVGKALGTVVERVEENG